MRYPTLGKCYCQEKLPALRHSRHQAGANDPAGYRKMQPVYHWPSPRYVCPQNIPIRVSAKQGPAKPLVFHANSASFWNVHAYTKRHATRPDFDRQRYGQGRLCSAAHRVIGTDGGQSPGFRRQYMTRSRAALALCSIWSGLTGTCRWSSCAAPCCHAGWFASFWKSSVCWFGSGVENSLCFRGKM